MRQSQLSHALNPNIACATLSIDGATLLIDNATLSIPIK
jgi:hypothetical protein